MKKQISLLWLRVERAPDLVFELLPWALLAAGGVLIAFLPVIVH